MLSATIDSMQEFLIDSNIQLNSYQLEKLWQFHQHLYESNKQLNLTRILNFEAMMRKHYVDCLLVADILKKNKISFPHSLIDLGSGGGFPGIPLAIYCPNTEFLLVEATRKRVVFLEESIQLLGLKNVSDYHKNLNYKDFLNYDGAITRAVESVPASLHRLQNCVKKDGIYIFMKGPNCSEEIEVVKTDPELKLRFKQVLNYKYSLPQGTDRRCLLVYKNINKATYEKHDPPVVQFLKEKSAGFIHSKENKYYKELRSLKDSQGIKKNRKTLISGTTFIKEFVTMYPSRAKRIILNEKIYKENNESHLFQFLSQNKKIEYTIFKQELFETIDFNGSKKLLLEVDVPDYPNVEEINNDIFVTPSSSSHSTGPAAAMPIYLFLSLGQPDNLGAALRVCKAFPVKKIILLKECAHPFHYKSNRASCGANFSLPITVAPRMSIHDVYLSLEKIEDLEIASLDMNGQNIEEFDWSSLTGNGANKKLALILGEEGQGLPQPITGKSIRIPMSEELDSLNSSMALGIALYVLQRFYRNK